MQDENQVYDDGINAPGEFGLELHVNTMPSGNGASSYAGEVTSFSTRLIAVFAGLSVAGVLLPEAVAYAAIAGVSAIMHCW